MHTKQLYYSFNICLVVYTRNSNTVPKDQEWEPIRSCLYWLPFQVARGVCCTWSICSQYCQTPGRRDSESSWSAFRSAIQSWSVVLIWPHERSRENPRLPQNKHLCLPPSDWWLQADTPCALCISGLSATVNFGVTIHGRDPRLPNEAVLSPPKTQTLVDLKEYMVLNSMRDCQMMLCVSLRELVRVWVCMPLALHVPRSPWYLVTADSETGGATSQYATYVPQTL